MLFDVTDSTSYSEVGDVALRKLLQQFPAIDPTPVRFAGYRRPLVVVYWKQIHLWAQDLDKHFF